MPGFKAAKDRLTLLFGGNASGDMKLKPLLVYLSENPKALKNIAQRKDKESQEEDVTEELKRFTTQEMARGFSLLEEALFVFEAQDPNVERYTKVAAAIQSAVRCYRVIYDEKKKS